MAVFKDILTIKNGKNQKAVENPQGRYPIYGSGGIMGYADSYICEPETVIIGRKGNINNPIFCENYFWNIDTAFGLVADKRSLLPKYLFYFCKNFDFQSLNTTVTIPSLTKTNLLNIHINLPSLSEQKRIASILDKATELIALRKQQIEQLDLLVKSRFTEMFGDPVCNNKCLPTIRGEEFFKLSNGKFIQESKRFKEGIPAYGGNGISWYTDDALCNEDTLVVGRVGFQSGNVHLAKAPLSVTDNAMYISRYDKNKFDLLFLCSLMEQINFTRYQDAGDLRKITQKPFMGMDYIFPPLSQQKEYTAFVQQVDKSKSTLQQSLGKLELNYKALMQTYFG